MTIDYPKIIQDLGAEIDPQRNEGQVAQYIPELAKVDPSKYGLALQCLGGDQYTLGAAEEKFSTQSIAKVFSLALAMLHGGNAIWERVDVEPSGTSFNSLVLLEYEEGIPRNPFINSGALVVADLLVELLDNPKGTLLSWIRQMADDQAIDFNYAVAASEESCGHRNRAMAHMLKGFGNIHGQVDEVLNFYYHLCSVEMSCKQLAQAFTVFANDGCQAAGQRLLSSQQSHRINALMQTCGFYDEAGEFAFRVGLPGKSGVGGGIAAVYPGHYSIAVWSPQLNPQGNSVLGMESLESLTSKTGMGVF
jgi:glutaminase